MIENIAVELGSDIIHVYGTVNGDVVGWSPSGGAWRAIVPRASDGIYKIEITAWDAASNSKTFSFTLNYGLVLITDRTQSDVNYANALNMRIAANSALDRHSFDGFTQEERLAWLNGLKGAYSYSDWNRVESAVRFLSDLLREYGYTTGAITRTDWTRYDIPMPKDLEQRYLGNIRAMIDTFHVLPTTPAPPDDMHGLTYEEANAIEQILLDIYFAIQRMITGWFMSGEIMSGEV